MKTCNIAKSNNTQNISRYFLYLCKYFPVLWGVGTKLPKIFEWKSKIILFCMKWKFALLQCIAKYYVFDLFGHCPDNFIINRTILQCRDLNLVLRLSNRTSVSGWLKNLQWVFRIEFVLFESLSIRFKSWHCKIVRFIIKYNYIHEIALSWPLYLGFDFPCMYLGFGFTMENFSM